MASSTGYDLDTVLKEYEKSQKALKKKKEDLNERVETLFEEAVNGEKQKLLLQSKLDELNAKLEEFYTLSESQEDLIRKLEKKNEEATQGLLVAEKALNGKVPEIVDKEKELFTADLCSALVEKLKCSRFEQASEIKTMLEKEEQDLQNQLIMKQVNIEDLQKRLAQVNSDMDNIPFAEVSVETKSTVLEDLRKQNRKISLKLLQLRLEQAKFDEQCVSGNKNA